MARSSKPEKIFSQVFLLLWVFAIKAAGGDPNIKTVSDAVKQIESNWNSLPDKNGGLEILSRRSRSAILTLSHMGVGAVPDIENALYDTKLPPHVRGILCESLDGMPGDDVIELLGKIIGDSTQHRLVRLFAARAIVKKQGLRADEIIKHAIGDTSLSEGARAELMMDTSQRGHNDVDWLAQVSEGRGFGLPADPHAEISQAAVGIMLNAQRTLGFSKNSRATEVMIAYLEKYPTADIFIEALGKRGDPKAVPILLKCLRSPTRNMSRQSAAKSLGLLRSKEAVNPLIDIMLHDQDIFVVVDAASALAEIGDKRALPSMERFVGDLKADSRFDAVYWKQATQGWGPFPPILRALDKLKGR